MAISTTINSITLDEAKEFIRVVDATDDTLISALIKTADEEAQTYINKSYADFTAIPEAIKSWVKIRVSTLYEFREQFVIGGSVSTMPPAHNKTLLDIHKKVVV